MENSVKNMYADLRVKKVKKIWSQTGISIGVEGFKPVNPQQGMLSGAKQIIQTHVHVHVQHYLLFTQGTYQIGQSNKFLSFGEIVKKCSFF